MNLALALATPVRCCSFTGLRLPEHFHLDFGLQPHPTTGAPWYLPRIVSDNNYKTEPSPTLEQATSGPADSTSPNELSSTHLPAHADALRFISKLKRRQFRHLIPWRWKEDLTLNLDELVFREDMADYVLSLLRNNVVRRLAYLGARTAGYISRCDGWDYIDKHHQVAAVLWLGEPRTGAKAVGKELDEKVGGPRSSALPATEVLGEVTADDSAALREEGPPPYAMVHYKGRYVPAYNLPSLLRQKDLGRLETECEHMRGSMAILKHKHATVEVQMALWKLMGYLAPYKEE